MGFGIPGLNVKRFLEGRLGLGELTLPQQDSSQVDRCLRAAGLDDQGLAIHRDGLVVLPAGGLGCSEIEKGHGVVGPERRAPRDSCEWPRRI